MQFSEQKESFEKADQAWQWPGQLWRHYGEWLFWSSRWTFVGPCLKFQFVSNNRLPQQPGMNKPESMFANVILNSRNAFVSNVFYLVAFYASFLTEKLIHGWDLTLWQLFDENWLKQINFIVISKFDDVLKTGQVYPCLWSWTELFFQDIWRQLFCQL